MRVSPQTARPADMRREPDDKLSEWLKALGLSEYEQRFADNGLALDVLQHLTDQDLKDIGVLLGHRRKMLAAIARLSIAGPVAFQPTPTAVESTGRKNITVNWRRSGVSCR